MMRSVPPYPAGSDDLRLRTVLELGPTPRIDRVSWALAASHAAVAGTDRSLAPDSLIVPVVDRGELFSVTLGDLMRPDSHAADVAAVLRATVAATAAHLAQARVTAAVARRLMVAPAATVNGAPR